MPPISLSDIPDMEEDLDLGGLPSWNSKPKTTASKPAPAPAAKPASSYASEAKAGGAETAAQRAAKYGGSSGTAPAAASSNYSSNDSAAKYGGSSASAASATSTSNLTPAQRAARYGGGGGASTKSEEETPAQRGAKYGGGSASTSKYEEEDYTPSKYTSGGSSYSSGGYQPKARVAEPEPEPEPEPEAAVEGDDAGIDIGEMDMDERNALAAQIEQELSLDGLGLPNFRKGDYGSAAPRATRVVDKGNWTASTNTKTGAGPQKTRAQLLREGKDVLSVREQREADAQVQKDEFVAAAIKMQCTAKGCTFQAVGKRGYCATHQIEHNKRLEATKATATSPRSTPGSAQYQPAPKSRCSGCGQGIVGAVVEALGAHWHEQCFCCRGCGAEFPSGKFVNIKQQPYCRACAAAASGASASGASEGTCRGCRKPITNEGVEAMGASWHKHCFVCTYCGKPFVGGKFSSVKGEPFCNQQCFENRVNGV